MKISIKDSLKINDQDGFNISTYYCLVLEIFVFYNVLLYKLTCDVICSRIPNEIYQKKYLLKKLAKFI